MAGRGQPPKFASPELLEQAFAEWQVTFDDPANTDIPDVEGFCDFVGAYRDLLSEYAGKENFSDTIKRIKNWIYYKKKQLAMQNKMPAAIFIFDAKNNAGYVDKTVEESYGEQKIVVVTRKHTGDADEND